MEILTAITNKNVLKFSTVFRQEEDQNQDFCLKTKTLFSVEKVKM